MAGISTSHYKYFWRQIFIIYFLDLLLSRTHTLKALFNIQAVEGSCLIGASQKISAPGFLIFLVLIYGFLLYVLAAAMQSALDSQRFHPLPTLVLHASRSFKGFLFSEIALHSQKNVTSVTVLLRL